MSCAHRVFCGLGRLPNCSTTVASLFPCARLDLLILLGLLVPMPGISRAQGGFQLVSGKAFDAAIPRDFYLEGNAIPVEKRNAVLLKGLSGRRVLVALLDTSGYSSQVQEKYTGMLIGEAPVKLCGIELGAGSYGFGLERPARGTSRKAELKLYDQSGRRLGACAAEEDQALSRPVPLQATPEPGSRARLYLGRSWILLEEAGQRGE